MKTDPAGMTGRRRRRLRILLVGLCAIIGLIVLAPQIVAWSPLRHELPRRRLKGFSGNIRVGAASLSWWGPTVLTNLELDAPNGERFFLARRVTESCTAWGALFRRDEPLHVVIEDPLVNVVLRPDGSNVEDALAPVLAHAGHQKRQRTTQVSGATVQIVDSASGATAGLRNVSVDSKADATDGSANQIALRADEGDSAAHGHCEIQIDWPGDAGWNPRFGGGTRNLSLQIRDMSFDWVQPLIRRVAPDAEVKGLASGQAHFTLNRGTAPDSPTSISGDWDLACRDTRISAPGLFGTDTPSPGPTEFRGRYSQAGANCRLDDLHLKTDFCTLDGGLAFLGDEAIVGTAARDMTARLPLPELELKGEVDLVALARQLPSALGTREGVEWKEGRIRFDVASGSELGTPKWSGHLETSRIAARIGGEEVAWGQPFSLQLAARRRQGQYEIDSIESQSDVFMLHGTATAAGLHVEAGCDLHELLSRLGKFVNTDALEARGTLTAAADFTHDVDRLLQIDSQVSLSDFTLRRLVTRMIERRAGDMQQPPAASQRPPLQPPMPFEPPRNRKELAAQKKMQRQARQEDRRREREAHREANQIVQVPMQEWQTVWSEPHFKVTGRSRLDFASSLIELPRLELESDGVHVTGKGKVSEIPRSCVVELAGDVEYDMARLVERARGLLGPYIQVTGRDTRQFSITGPLRISTGAADQRPLVPLELTASAAASWQQANLFGLPAGPGSLDWTLTQGMLAAQPLEVALGSGKVRLAPRVLLTGRPATLVVPEGPVVVGVELTDEFCDGWLKFIAPILSHATRCSGRFSLDVDESHLVLADPAAGNLTGRLRIERGEVLPGPLFDAINSLIGNIISGVGVGAPQDLLGLDRPLVQIVPQTVAFGLHEGRIHHEPMEFQARGIVIRTRGSVGIDQTLDLLASIKLSDDLLPRVRLLGALKGQALEIPISGTLRRPRLDPRATGRLAEQLGQNALDALLNGGLQKLFEGND